MARPARAHRPPGRSSARTVEDPAEERGGAMAFEAGEGDVMHPGERAARHLDRVGGRVGRDVGSPARPVWSEDVDEDLTVGEAVAAAAGGDLRELEASVLEDPTEPPRAVLEHAHVDEYVAVQAGARRRAFVLETMPGDHLRADEVQPSGWRRARSSSVSQTARVRSSSGRRTITDGTTARGTRGRRAWCARRRRRPGRARRPDPEPPAGFGRRATRRRRRGGSRWGWSMAPARTSASAGARSSSGRTVRGRR